MHVNGLVGAPVGLAPDIGQHSRQILSECGLSEAEIDRMLKEGAAA
jgi:crotonobetainyl-CoA:carnitine CoA-transferase CaiB-like acyl-CoA transferase